MLPDYLLLYHKDDIIKILEDEDDSKHFSISIKLDCLLQEDSLLANKLLKEFESLTADCDDAIISAQKAILDELENDTFIIKTNVHIRLYNFPPCPELVRTALPKNQDMGLFLEVTGTVIRTTVSKLLEFQRSYRCVKCRETMIVKADFEQKYSLIPPTRCINSECNGSKFTCESNLDRMNSKDYQEIKLQEQVAQSTMGLIPNSLWVILEDDLVDSCKPGDNVSICGIVKRRWKIPFAGKRIDVEIVIKANHVLVNNDISAITVLTPQIKEYFSVFWRKYKKDPLKGRDAIVKSFCPQVYGLYIVKLALMATLAGGSLFKNSDTKIKTRSEPHLLLVGDPGTGKSQLLKFASQVISRSVFTTGVGSTSAGLTVAAINENGEWQLEAGALVLSDGGICCIDEFNSMKEHDRISIHEAMEQQTLSVAKASIVCKLNTRCSILAATNPKGNLDSSQNFNANIGMASPLLSRFDLVFILKDSINTNWDSLVADFILSDCVDEDKQEILWDLQTLQAYIIYIKRIHPILTDDTNRILSSYYQLQRRTLSRNKARTTVRLLDSLVRLSQAHARLMYHTEVEILDAVMAVTLIEASMQGDSSVLGLGFDTHSSSPENPTESYTQLIRTVLCKLKLEDLLQKEVERLQELRNNPGQSTDENLETDKTLYNRFKNIFKKTPTVISKRKSHEFVSDEFSKKIKLNTSQDTTAFRNSEDSESLKGGSETNDEVSDAINVNAKDDQTEVTGVETHKKRSTKDLLAKFHFKPRNTATDAGHSKPENLNNEDNPIANDDLCVRNNADVNKNFNLGQINSKVVETQADFLSQNTRNNRFFDQYRFKARDALANEKVLNQNLQANKSRILNYENTTVGLKCSTQLTKNPKINVFKDVASTPRSTTHYSQTVFERQEDYDDLDLGIDE